MRFLLEYLEKYGQQSLDDVEFNDVDRLIFAQLAYLNFENAYLLCNRPLFSALEYISFAKTDSAPEQRFCFQSKDDQRLCKTLQASSRYKNVRFLDFISQWDPASSTQFAALALQLPDGCKIIVFRGTDMTLAGWKEDFDMAYKSEIPAQALACEFANHQTKVCESFELIGHSKGGNLALYAACHCDMTRQQKLRCAVSFDGPGLSKETIQSDAFQRVQNRMRVLIPRNSLVGLLFDQPDDIRIVECRKFSVIQHYPFTWKTCENGFSYCENSSRSMQKIADVIRIMLEKMSLELREQFIEAVYEIVVSTGADTLNELISGWITNTPNVVRKLCKETDKETYLLLLRTLKIFWISVAENFGISISRNDHMFP